MGEELHAVEAVQAGVLFQRDKEVQVSSGQQEGEVMQVDEEMPAGNRVQAGGAGW